LFIATQNTVKLAIDYTRDLKPSIMQKRIAIDIREALSKEPAGKGIYNLKTTKELIKNKDIKCSRIVVAFCS